MDRKMCHKVVLIGDTDVGKSSLFVRFISGKFDEQIKFTQALDHCAKAVAISDLNNTQEHNEVLIDLWDTAGLERDGNMTSNYYRSAKVVILMYAIDNQQSLDALQYWIEDTKRYNDVNCFFLVGNKVDLPEDVSKETVIGFVRSIHPAVSPNHVFQVSVKTNQGLDELLNALATTLHNGNYAVDRDRLNMVDRTKDRNQKAFCEKLRSFKYYNKQISENGMEFLCNGIPSIFEEQSKSWRSLCNGHKYCAIYASAPGKMLFVDKDNHMKLIDEFVFPVHTRYHQQSPKYFIINTGTQTFGITVLQQPQIDVVKRFFERTLQYLSRSSAQNPVNDTSHVQMNDSSKLSKAPTEVSDEEATLLYENPDILKTSNYYARGANTVAQGSVKGQSDVTLLGNFATAYAGTTNNVKVNKETSSKPAEMEREDEDLKVCKSEAEVLINKTNYDPLSSLKDFQFCDEDLDIVEAILRAVNMGDKKQVQCVVESILNAEVVHDRSAKKEVNKSNIIRIQVQVEDKFTSGGSVLISVDPHVTTVDMLKEKFSKEHHFPCAAQQWIINQRLVHGSESLESCGVETTGTVIFLYLKSITVCDVQRDVATQTEECASFPEEIQFVVADQAVEVSQEIPEEEGWVCPDCTFKNLPTIPGCGICFASRPEDYLVPEGYHLTEMEMQRIEKEEVSDRLFKAAEAQRIAEDSLIAQGNFVIAMQQLENNLLTNGCNSFECSICTEEIAVGEGVLLRECLHEFCKDCLRGTIRAAEGPEVFCPHNEAFACPAVITHQEIQKLLGDGFQNYLDRSLRFAENAEPLSYHCRTANCPGWFICEEEVNSFQCTICKKVNCLTCKTIHDGRTCQQFQDELKEKAQNDEAAKKTQDMLEELLRRGDAMHCPTCNVMLQKKVGCDWLACSMCRTELCWATKGRRWGPGGRGDTTGGCRCREFNNKPCAPNCKNCH